MSALAEALVAAQRRAVSAMEKATVAGRLDRDTVIALDGIGATLRAVSARETPTHDADEAAVQMCACEPGYLCPRCTGTPADPGYVDDDPRDDAEREQAAFSEGRSAYDQPETP